MAIRATVDPVTKEVTVSDLSSWSVPVGAPASEPAPIQQGVIRVVYNDADGTMQMSQNQPTGYISQEPVSPGGVTVRGPGGRPTTLAMASENDVADFGPGRGDTTIKAALQLGWLQPAVNGRGFELAGVTPQNTQQQQQQQQQQDGPKREPAADPDDLRSVPGTSVTSDEVIATMTNKAPTALAGAIAAIAAGSDPSTIFQSVGRQLNDETFADRAAAMHSEMVASGRQVLRNVGVEENAMEDFEAWSLEHHHDAASDAMGDMVSHKSVDRLAELGRKFVAQSNERLAQIIQSKGVETRVDNESVYVKRSDLGLPSRGDFGAWMSLKAAIRAGHIEINR